jgi:hypothetical protein
MQDKKANVDENGRRILKFKTIDDWNRPVFKDSIGNLFGSVDKLFSWSVDLKEVQEKITEKDICYFGRHIDDDPMGTSINPDKIVLLYD